MSRNAKVYLPYFFVQMLVIPTVFRFGWTLPGLFFTSTCGTTFYVHTLRVMILICPKRGHTVNGCYYCMLM